MDFFGEIVVHVYSHQISAVIKNYVAVTRLDEDRSNHLDFLTVSNSSKLNRVARTSSARVIRKVPLRESILCRYALHILIEQFSLCL